MLGNSGEYPALFQLSQTAVHCFGATLDEFSLQPCGGRSQGGEIIVTDPFFACRENELARLNGFLDQAIAGQGRVVFITGEPGTGKTALMRAFIRQSQERVPNLIMAGGVCNDQAGVGEPYLPFREVLTTLVGGLKIKLEQDQIAQTNSGRLKKIVAQSGMLLIEAAPSLVGAFVPTLAVVGVLGSQAIKQYGLSAKLETTAKQKLPAHALADVSLNQENVFEQYTRYILKLSEQVPLLITFDDMQWADPSSLGLLFHLGRRLGDQRVLVLCSYRQDEVAQGIGGERHPLEKLQAEFLRIYGENTLALDPDDTAEDRRLVNAIVDSEPNRLGPEFRQALSRHTEGNPLFVRELLHAMEERGDLLRNSAGYWEASPDLDWGKLPARVQGVIQERIDRLAADLREVLEDASIQGEQFVAEVIASLRKVADRELIARLSGDLSRRHQLVEAIGSERVEGRRISLYRFSHNLVQKYLYQKMDPIELSYLHEDVGRLLEQLYAGDLEEVVVELAWHFDQAGVVDKAAHYALLAGRKALDRYAYEEALEHLNRGLELTPADDRATRYELTASRELVYSRMGKRQPQLQDLETLTGLASASGQPAAALEVLLRQVQYYLETGEYPRALELVQQAADLAAEIGLAEQEVRGYALLGRILFHQSEYDRSREWLELAEQSAREAGFSAVLARVVYDLGMVDYYQGRFTPSVQRYEQALALYLEQGNEKGQVNCRLMQGTIHAILGAYSQARLMLEDALDHCRRISWRRGETYILGNLGGIALNLGQLEEAQNRYEWALQICREVDDREGEAVNQDALGLVQHFLGFPERALELFNHALEIDLGIGYKRGEGFALTHVGQANLALNRPDQAAEAFRAALAVRQEIETHPGLLADDRAGLAEALRQLGDQAAALELARQALNALAEFGPGQVEYPVQVYIQCLGVLQAAGEPDTGPVRQSALNYLHQQVATIQDESLRQDFQDRLPFNQALLASQPS